MRCEDIREMISDFIDGAAGPDDEAQVREHLAACPECRALHEQWKRINDALKNGPPAQPEEPYWDSYRGRLQSRLSLEPQRVLGTGSVYTWGWVAAAVLLVALGVAVMVAVGQARRASEPSGRAAQAGPHSLPLPAPGATVLPTADSSGADMDTRLFHELDSTFDGGVRWVATDGKKIDFGVSTELNPAPRPAAAAGTERVAAVAVSVCRAEGGRLEPVDEARIVARSGCRADFLAQAGGLEFSYECQPLIRPDGGVRLRLGVGVANSEGDNYAAANAVVELQSGQTTEVARVVSGGVSYAFNVTLFVLPAQEPAKRTGV